MKSLMRRYGYAKTYSLADLMAMMPLEGDTSFWGEFGFVTAIEIRKSQTDHLNKW